MTKSIANGMNFDYGAFRATIPDSHLQNSKSDRDAKVDDNNKDSGNNGVYNIHSEQTKYFLKPETKILSSYSKNIGTSCTITSLGREGIIFMWRN
jgi:hypothetical protein